MTMMTPRSIDGRRRQACLRTIDSTTSEMSSRVLSAASIAWTMSFHFRTSSASNSPLNRRAERSGGRRRRPRSRAGRWRRGGADALHRLEPRRCSSTVWSAICTSRSACSLSSGMRLVDAGDAGGGGDTASMSSTTSSSSSASAWMSSRSKGVTKRRVEALEDRAGELVAPALAGDDLVVSARRSVKSVDQSRRRRAHSAAFAAESLNSAKNPSSDGDAGGTASRRSGPGGQVADVAAMLTAWSPSRS